MRIASCLLAFAALTASLVLPATPAAAQQPTTPPPACDGSYNIIRISDINPGMMQKFLDAVAAQQAWYQNAGVSDQIAVMRIIDMKAGTYVPDQAVTSHVEPSMRGKRPVHDAGYDAFVAMFKASSTIKSEYFTCMAK